MPSLSRLEFLVEEPSVEAALSHLVPKLLGPDLLFSVYPHQGKRDLMKKLPARLRGYRRWMPEDWGIVVLIDADGQDCIEQKGALEGMARQAGLMTRSVSRGGRSGRSGEDQSGPGDLRLHGAGPKPLAELSGVSPGSSRSRRSLRIAKGARPEWTERRRTARRLKFVGLQSYTTTGLQSEEGRF